MKSYQGFTLIEVLLALAVIAIALTALLKVTAQNIDHTRRIKEKTLSHQVAMQAISMIQLHLITPTEYKASTQVTTMLNEPWYWRATLRTTPIKTIQEITIATSQKQMGPFQKELTGFRYTP